jgi:hypothetical protein
VLDNYATHKTPAIKEWLVKHPRFHLHFTPTSSSWLNLVERWFAELTNRKLRRSAHRSVTELETDIRKWISEWNKDPKPLTWTKSADEILETLAEYCQRITGPGDARAVSGQDLRILLGLLDAMDDHFDRRISDQEFLRLSASARDSLTPPAALDHCKPGCSRTGGNSRPVGRWPGSAGSVMSRRPGWTASRLDNKLRQVRRGESRSA